jgi:RNA polymerase sigma factor (sigma-70 family)
VGDREAKEAMFDAFSEVAKALGNGRRAELIDVLAQGERHVEDLAGEIGHSVANTSFHLRVLATSGLVTTRRDRTRIYYRLASGRVAELWAALREQDSFIKVFSSLDRYNSAYAFSSWLFKITSNLCIDYLRKRRIDTLPMDQPIDGEKGEIQRQYAASDPTPEESLDRRETMVRLESAIAALPEHYRIMLILRHQEDLSYEDIADHRSIPLGTVKARIHRAREMLKGMLGSAEFPA